MRILFCHSANPRHKSSIQIQPFHANMFLHTDWYTMQRTNGLLVVGKVSIEESCAVKGSLGEKFRNTIRLRMVS